MWLIHTLKTHENAMTTRNYLPPSSSSSITSKLRTTFTQSPLSPHLTSQTQQQPFTLMTNYHIDIKSTPINHIYLNFNAIYTTNSNPPTITPPPPPVLHPIHSKFTVKTWSFTLPIKCTRITHCVQFTNCNVDLFTVRRSGRCTPTRSVEVLEVHNVSLFDGH
jgi:hypothetical protein